MSGGEMTAHEFKALCKLIHARYGKALDMAYQESCSLADDVFFGNTTTDSLFENLDEAVEDEEGGEAS